MRLLRYSAFFLLAGGLAVAGLTPEQRVQDLQTLAALYIKRYAPYEWKREMLISRTVSLTQLVFPTDGLRVA